MCQTRRVDEKFEIDAETSRKESTPPPTFPLIIHECVCFNRGFAAATFLVARRS
jgi:hypothetical protein